MPTVKSEGDSASELEGATLTTSSTPGLSVKTTRTVGTMTNSGRTRVTRVKTEHSSATENENEEDRVARRREQWRLKKREQRAKVAARLTKTRERISPVITASAHFLFPHANQGGQTQTQTLRKSAQMATESSRKSPHFVPPSSITRCRTTWQRSLEAKRHQKVKSSSMTLTSKMRSIPPVDAGDTPEQIIAKQREYWRIKKREQRAKMSMEAKARLKEKDSLKRRVRRYQNILKEMRRARASEHGLETIGGFIKEDGTVSVGIPQTKSVNGIAVFEPKVLPRAPTQSSKTTPVNSFSQLTLTCPLSRRKAGIPEAASRVGRAGCVMKMLVSDKALTIEDRMAKKREYWRVTKRQQRAARSARLRQGIAEARLAPAVQGDKGPRLASQAPLFNTSEPTHAIKREPDLNPTPEQDQSPDLKLPLMVPKRELDPAPAADSQATTLLVVASMKKLLEESLSTVNDGKDQKPDVETKVKGEPDKPELNEEPDGAQVAPVVQAQEPDAVRRHCPSAAASLQKKREYWKLMKRQQRARQKERQGKGGGGGGRGAGARNRPLRSNQAPALAVRSINVAKTPVKLLPKPASSSGSSVPIVLLKLPETLAVQPPNCADLDPALPTLKPPDNPLSHIILHLIEAPARSARPAPLKRSWPSPAPLHAMSTPKRRPEESEEDFLKRKREYWRIKKKQQRARKSQGEKWIPQRRDCVPPAQDLQEFCQRAMSGPLSDAAEHFISNSVDSMDDSHDTAPLQDELLSADAERAPGEEDPVSEGTWRNFYLMDYDPLNQLLVCMACGEQQHSHSPESALAHIDEAHPHTRALEPAERRRILEAWDEQVSRRERFFTRQLQRRDATLAETYSN